MKNKIDTFENYTLFSAAENGVFHQLTPQLTSQENLKIKDRRGFTPLTLAAYHNKLFPAIIGLPHIPWEFLETQLKYTPRFKENQEALKKLHQETKLEWGKKIAQKINQKSSSPVR